MTEAAKVVLVDSDFLVYRVGFSDREASEGIAKSRLTKLLFDVVFDKLKADDYKAWLTGPNNFRYALAKTTPYKGNRKDMEKPPHYEALREHLMRLGAVLTEGIEADDAVAIEMTKTKGCTLVGVDKDLLQIPGLHYNPVTDTHLEISEFQGAYNFYKQMLTGDRVDSIPGLEGVGPAKATKALKDCTTEKELEEAVWKVYQDKGHGWDYFVEQGSLLWLQRYEGEVWRPRYVVAVK